MDHLLNDRKELIFTMINGNDNEYIKQIAER